MASVLAALKLAGPKTEPLLGTLDAMDGIMLRLGPRNCEAGLDGRRAVVEPSSGAPDMPLAAAAIAAMLPAAVELMLFLRVTRCAGWMEPMDSECECGRVFGSEPAAVLECRCWLDGRAAVGSCSGRRSARGQLRAGERLAEGTKGRACLEDSHGAERVALFVRRVP